jgi:hypothetical protein
MTSRLSMPLKFIACGFFFLWLVGCSGGTKKNQETTSESVSHKADKPVHISQVNLFLETSASMKGYLSGDTEFKSTIARLISQLEKAKSKGTITNSQYFLIPQDTTAKAAGEADQFLNLLKKNQLAVGKNSLIVDIFRMLGARNQSGTVNIFISDCILSDFDIRNKSIIQEEVALVFNRFTASHTATSVYAFISEFNGNYYPYTKGIQSYEGVNRPYYVWVFGKSREADALNKALKEEGFKPEEELHVGFDFNEHPAYSLMNYTGKQGEYILSADNQRMEEAKLYKGDVIGITIGIDLSAYPDKLTHKSYLNPRTMVFRGKNVEGRVVAISLLDKAQLMQKDVNLAEKNNLTHFVTVELTSLKAKEASFDLVLPKKDLAWYKDWSVDDDSKIKENEGKTFALAYLIGGVKEAYQDNSDYFKITIPITKQ